MGIVFDTVFDVFTLQKGRNKKLEPRGWRPAFLPLMEIPGNKLSELLYVAFKKNTCMINDRVALVITFHHLLLFQSQL